MKPDWEDSYEMRAEYDFSNGIRNPWFQDFRELNLVSLEPDVKTVFPDSSTVNAALRELIELRRERAAKKQEAA